MHTSSGYPMATLEDGWVRQVQVSSYLKKAIDASRASLKYHAFHFYNPSISVATETFYIEFNKKWLQSSNLEGHKETELYKTVQND